MSNKSNYDEVDQCISFFKVDKIDFIDKEENNSNADNNRFSPDNVPVAVKNNAPLGQPLDAIINMDEIMAQQDKDGYDDVIECSGSEDVESPRSSSESEDDTRLGKRKITSYDIPSRPRVDHPMPKRNLSPVDNSINGTELKTLDRYSLHTKQYDDVVDLSSDDSDEKTRYLSDKIDSPINFKLSPKDSHWNKKTNYSLSRPSPIISLEKLPVYHGGSSSPIGKCVMSRDPNLQENMVNGHVLDADSEDSEKKKKKKVKKIKEPSFPVPDKLGSYKNADNDIPQSINYPPQDDCNGKGSLRKGNKNKKKESKIKNEFLPKTLPNFRGYEEVDILVQFIDDVNPKKKAKKEVSKTKKSGDLNDSKSKKKLNKLSDNSPKLLEKNEEKDVDTKIILNESSAISPDHQNGTVTQTDSSSSLSVTSDTKEAIPSLVSTDTIVVEKPYISTVEAMSTTSSDSAKNQNSHLSVADGPNHRDFTDRFVNGELVFTDYSQLSENGGEDDTFVPVVSRKERRKHQQSKIVPDVAPTQPKSRPSNRFNNRHPPSSDSRFQRPTGRSRPPPSAVNNVAPVSDITPPSSNSSYVGPPVAKPTQPPNKPKPLIDATSATTLEVSEILPVPLSTTSLSPSTEEFPPLATEILTLNATDSGTLCAKPELKSSDKPCDTATSAPLQQSHIKCNDNLNGVVKGSLATLNKPPNSISHRRGVIAAPAAALTPSKIDKAHSSRITWFSPGEYTRRLQKLQTTNRFAARVPDYIQLRDYMFNSWLAFRNEREQSSCAMSK